jgi:hypothetical protein
MSAPFTPNDLINPYLPIFNTPAAAEETSEAKILRLAADLQGLRAASRTPQSCGVEDEVTPSRSTYYYGTPSRVTAFL